MKKIFIVFLLLSLILMMGCQPQRSPSEVRESADELIAGIYYLNFNHHSRSQEFGFRKE